MLHVVLAVTAMQFVMYFRFCGWRHDGANRPKSKTTRMFRPVRQMAAHGAKSAVYNCILFSMKRCGLLTELRTLADGYFEIHRLDQVIAGS